MFEVARFMDEMRSLQHTRGTQLSSMRDTVLKTRQTIAESRQLLAQVEAVLTAR
ncbi:MAG TPA: hypothetical protein VE224_08450 [Pseudolabrys sp.]|jgi:hypothetical protein|nr:hypothetical protein [Pseudolabrys sp.]